MSLDAYNHSMASAKKCGCGKIAIKDINIEAIWNGCIIILQ